MRQQRSRTVQGKEKRSSEQEWGEDLRRGGSGACAAALGGRGRCSLLGGGAWTVGSKTWGWPCGVCVQGAPPGRVSSCLLLFTASSPAAPVRPWSRLAPDSASPSPAGASSHSLRYFYTGVSEPGQGLPQFVVVGYVDGQRIVHYDSDTRRMTPRAPWMAKAGEEDPQYWDWQTQVLQGSEATFRADLETLRHRYNQSAGFHTWQTMHGCELSGDRPSKGYFQYSYDGRDFLALDKETLTWTAADAAAQITKRNWEAEPAIAQQWKGYLEEICIEWLRKYLHYGNETLQRRERPVVTVSRKDSHDGLETLLCRAHGFYPKEIDITWRRDGEVRKGDTFEGVISPNQDGTYYTWLSIEVDPQERSRYRCHVDHDGLEEPLDVAVEKSASMLLWLIPVVVVLAVLLVAAAAGLYFYNRSDKGSDSSMSASPPLGV
ncbi:hypothetical protein lerEdw1_020708 [Lerista edwardsae]|nr:hypothetical protein lerEdw1_020708 [Lerista edwardsae]